MAYYNTWKGNIKKGFIDACVPLEVKRAGSFKVTAKYGKI
jgi:hypothetical protein